eukprot:COSAG03_NODE_24410_length_272_cov_0.895954_1_plen_49_part_01
MEKEVLERAWRAIALLAPSSVFKTEVSGCCSRLGHCIRIRQCITNMAWS